MELLPHQKLCMSIQEAASYSCIGHDRLRQIIADNPGLDFVIHKGKQVIIKRMPFESWVNNLRYI